MAHARHDNQVKILTYHAFEVGDLTSIGVKAKEQLDRRVGFVATALRQALQEKARRGGMVAEVKQAVRDSGSPFGAHAHGAGAAPAFGLPRLPPVQSLLPIAGL